MAGRQKVIADEVHQNQILRELYLKELRTQKLYTQYHVNPLRKASPNPSPAPLLATAILIVHTITRKPMSWHDNLEEPEDVRLCILSVMRSWKHCFSAVWKVPSLPRRHQDLAHSVSPHVLLLQPPPDTQTKLPRDAYSSSHAAQESPLPSSPIKGLLALTPHQVNPERNDHRLNHFRVYKDITLYKAKMWSLGEDDRHK
ncbi:Protein FAM183A [Pteropus alecto]|uniref:Protein FAM183A n=1 Tax=Pteropus alecto TaxID=9402 RepID=L5KQS5_PTEAL|nr:Protein FAM183A [Pteropus alecto]